jgi:hypothetical protein
MGDDMATQALPRPGYGRDDRFFLTMAIVMALTVVAGFSMQLAMGRSSFRSPLYVHVHAVTFFGWVVLYVTQNVFVTRGTMTLHRALGWIGAFWALALVLVGTHTTLVMVQAGRVPFFFVPAYFLIMNPLAVLCFAGLTYAAIFNRRRTAWHRRLIYCGMAELTGPAFGRLLPVPFMIPWVGWGVFAAVMVFVGIGMIADLRRNRRVHPAWWWGAGTMIAVHVGMDLISYSPLGLAIYQWATVGTPGAAIDPFAYPPFPPMG